MFIPNVHAVLLYVLDALSDCEALLRLCRGVIQSVELELCIMILARYVFFFWSA